MAVLRRKRPWTEEIWYSFPMKSTLDSHFTASAPNGDCDAAPGSKVVPLLG